MNYEEIACYLHILFDENKLIGITDPELCEFGRLELLSYFGDFFVANKGLFRKECLNWCI